MLLPFLLFAHVCCGHVTLHLTTLAPHAAQALHTLHSGGVLLGAITAHEAVLLGTYAALRALRVPYPQVHSVLLTVLTGVLSAPLWTPDLTVSGLGGLFLLCFALTALAVTCVTAADHRTLDTP